MKEENLISSLLVTGLVQQQLLAVLSSKGLIDLSAMHTELTEELIAALQKLPPSALDLSRVETGAVASMDQLFSTASRIAARLSGPANPGGAGDDD